MIAYDGNATVKVLKGPNAGKCLVLSDAETVIGRESHCNLVLPSATVSRRHARIVHDAQGFFVQDLGSLNGTFVNSARVSNTLRLRGGDHIQIDEVLLSFRQMPGRIAKRTRKTLPTIPRRFPPPPTPPRHAPPPTTWSKSGPATACGLKPSRLGNSTRFGKCCTAWALLSKSAKCCQKFSAPFEVFPQADRGHVFLTDESTGKLDSRAYKVRSCKGRPSSTLGPGNAQIAATAVATGKPALYSLVFHRQLATRSRARRAGAGAGLCAAGFAAKPHDRALELETEDAGHQFVAADLELLATVGRLAGQLVEHARLHERRSHEEARAREHAAVEQQRRLLQTVLDVLPVGVFIADSKGQILQANAEAGTIWGGPVNLSRDPSQYTRDFPAWSPELGRRLRWQEYGLARALAGDTANHGEELQIETLDHRQRTVLSYALPIKDAQQQITGGVWVLVDITDRKRAERIIRVANERKDKFLAILRMNCEIRWP